MASLLLIDDAADDPVSPDPIHFAVFPFRYEADSAFDPRTGGYYHSDDDIDYGLLHEMGRQLGTIDLYPSARDVAAAHPRLR